MKINLHNIMHLFFIQFLNYWPLFTLGSINIVLVFIFLKISLSYRSYVRKNIGPVIDIITKA